MKAMKRITYTRRDWKLVSSWVKSLDFQSDLFAHLAEEAAADDGQAPADASSMVRQHVYDSNSWP